MYPEARQAQAGNALNAMNRRNVLEGGSDAPTTAGRIEVGLQRAAQGLEMLHREIAEIEARFGAALRPTGPPPHAPGEQAAKIAAEPSPFAGALDRLNRQIEDAVAYLRSLNARVDL